MFDLIPNLVASVLTILFPVFASYKALRTNDSAQLQPWLMYWVSFALFTLFENYTYWILGWMPLYGTIRLLFLLYLVLPQTQGARLAYQQYIHPFLAHHEAHIEETIGEIHEKLQPFGLEYLGQLVELVKKYVLQMQPTPEHQRLGQPQGQSGVGGYAQSLLSRFSLPSARDGMAAPAGDFYGLISTATSILGRADRSSPAAQIEELSRSGTLIPAHIRTPSEKARFVNQQRDKLQVLLRALDNEADDDSLSRNRSELSFDRISDDEVRDGAAQRKSSGGGWFGFGGGAGAAGGAGDDYDRRDYDKRERSRDGNRDRHSRRRSGSEHEYEHDRHDRHDGHGRSSDHGRRSRGGDHDSRHGRSSGYDLAY